MIKEQLLKTKEVCEILNVRPSLICKWIKEGKIEYIRLPGGSYRYKQEHIDNLINNSNNSNTN